MQFQKKEVDPITSPIRGPPEAPSDAILIARPEGQRRVALPGIVVFTDSWAWQTRSVCQAQEVCT